MDYKMYLAIVLLSVGLVTCSPVEPDQDLVDELAKAVESMPYDYYNTGMWLNRMLTEDNRWKKWNLPRGFPQEEVNFVRALTAFTADIFKSDMAYYWPYQALAYDPSSGGRLSIDMKEQWSFRFDQRLVTRCQLIVKSVRDVVMKIRGREMDQKSEVNLKNYGIKAWPAIEQACEKILKEPERFMDLSYSVALKNELI